MVILTSCSLNTKGKNIFSDQLIYGGSSEIDLVQIDYKLEDSKQQKDNSIIDQLIKKLQGIELRQLSVDEEIELFKNKEILYNISLISLQNLNHDKEPKGGHALIFSTGEIVFLDIKTMSDGRTVSYISVNKEINKREAIISFIENFKK